MKAVARRGDMHACPRCKVITPIMEGSSRSKTDGKPTARVGDRVGCGAVITEGESKSTIDGKATAYLGSATSHGGKIISASTRTYV